MLRNPHMSEQHRMAPAHRSHAQLQANRRALALSLEQNVAGLVHPGRKIRRSPLIGMNFLHQLAVAPVDGLRGRAFLKAQHLIGLIFGHARARAMLGTPRISVSLICFTPGGRPAVKMRLKQARDTA